MNTEEIISMVFPILSVFIFVIIFSIFSKSIKWNMKNMKYKKDGEEMRSDMMTEAPEMVKKIFRDDDENNVLDFIEDNSPGSLKQQIEETGQRIKNIVRNIFFVIILIILMGMVYYYLIK